MSCPGVITCKAAVAWGPGEALMVEEVAVSPPMPEEIRVKVVCTSLCRSDVTQWESKAQPALFPRIFGHEASGIVESVGDGVTEYEVGDHILTVFIGECMHCKHCVSGKSNMCQKLGLERKGVMHTDQKTRFSIKGKPVYHYCAVSSFSEYTVVHSGCAVKISPASPMDRICLLSCGVAAGEFVKGIEMMIEIILRNRRIPYGYNSYFNEVQKIRSFLSNRTNTNTLIESVKIKSVYQSASLTAQDISFQPRNNQISFRSIFSKVVNNIPIITPKGVEGIHICRSGRLGGIGAAWKVADISKGSTVAIFGLGTVGLSVAQAAKLRDASQIIGVDTNSDKYEKAKAFGVTKVINPDDCDEPVQQVIKRLTDGGADYSFECVGDTGVVSSALQSCCDGWGLTVTLGVPKVKPEVSAHYALLLSGRTLKGSLFGGWKPKSDLPSLVDKYLNKEIQVDGLVTHDLPFSSINEAFNLMKEGKCLRCVIHM